MFIFDAHCDTLSANLDLSRNKGHFDIERAIKRGPGAQILAAFGRNQLGQLDRLRQYPASAGTAPNELYLLGAIEGGDEIASVKDLEPFIKRDIVFFGLTWNHDNLLAGGCFGSGGGLTPLGKEAVSFLERSGVIIDLAHASKQTFWDVLELAKKPVAVTHACCHALCPHPRNLDDSQMRALRDCNGVLGITFYPAFLNQNHPNKPTDISHVARHIEYAIEIMGTDSVGLGSDFDGCEVLPIGLEGVQDVPGLLYALDVDQGIREKVAGRNFLDLMQRRGYILRH
ncbi:MAG: membrane dipeptidase [Oscillospiraceae bacterium]|nr:membrane dipeptidase [Oscillospiraceae bacterium]